MHTIKADIAKNRLIVSLVGRFTVEDMRTCNADTFAELKKLKPGYDIITDITQFTVSGDDVAAEIEKAQEHFVATGARNGVRIVGDKVLSGMQFRRTAGIAGYRSINVKSMDEAEKLLAEVV
jgi:hypothetical protein